MGGLDRGTEVWHGEAEAQQPPFHGSPVGQKMMVSRPFDLSYYRHNVDIVHLRGASFLVVVVVARDDDDDDDAYDDDDDDERGRKKRMQRWMNEAGSRTEQSGVASGDKGAVRWSFVTAKRVRLLHPRNLLIKSYGKLKQSTLRDLPSSSSSIFPVSSIHPSSTSMHAPDWGKD